MRGPRLNHDAMTSANDAMASDIRCRPGPWTLAVWLVLLAGVALRVWAFAADRPVWIDEAVLADNIVERSFSRLIEPLAHNQTAPAGFLWIERFAVERLGTSELALRLFPLLAGIVGLFAFDAAARRLMSPVGRLAATTLVAANDSLIYYCQEIKPYGVDAAVTCVFLLLTVRVFQGGWKSRDLIVLAVAGALFAWLSLPFIFVAAGMMGCLLLASRAARASGRTSLGVAGTGLLVAGSYLLHYKLVIAAGASNQNLIDYWTQRGGFPPFPPQRLKDIAELLTKPLDFFIHPMGFTFAGLAAIFAATGAVMHWRRWTGTAMLLAPLGLTLLASLAKKYPFPVDGQHAMVGGGRLLLFALPGVFLLIGAGIERFSELAGTRGATAATIATVLLALHPFIHVAMWVRSIERPDVRDVLASFATQRKEGDAVHASWAAHQIASYYRHRLDLGDPSMWVGGKSVIVRDRALTDAAWVKSKDWFSISAEIDALAGRRVWFFIFHEPTSPSHEDEKFLLHWLADRATLVQQFTTADASMHLYEIRPQGLR